MRILIDESLPVKFADKLSGHEVLPLIPQILAAIDAVEVGRVIEVRPS